MLGNAITRQHGKVTVSTGDVRWPYYSPAVGHALRTAVSPKFCGRIITGRVESIESWCLGFIAGAGVHNEAAQSPTFILPIHPINGSSGGRFQSQPYLARTTKVMESAGVMMREVTQTRRDYSGSIESPGQSKERDCRERPTLIYTVTGRSAASGACKSWNTDAASMPEGGNPSYRTNFPRSPISDIVLKLN